jgi:hypothetical protein
LAIISSSNDLGITFKQNIFGMTSERGSDRRMGKVKL